MACPTMSVQRWQRLQAGGLWVDLSDRAKWELRGEDRVRYLNGQVTNDVRSASAAASIYACVTDVKGRIAGDVMVHVSPDGTALRLDAEAGLAETLGPRLERYIIADDAELEKVTENFALWHFLPKADEGEVPAPVEGAIAAERLGVAGWDVWAEAGFEPPAGAETMTAEEMEVLRIIRGVPRWPNELGSEVFPPEAGLSRRAMSYTKGCYIGQEVLSRIKTTGKMPRTLVGWLATESPAEIVVGDALWPCDGEKPIGEVTSQCLHPESGLSVGLAYLKQGAIQEDSQLLVSRDMARIVLRIDVFPDISQ